jgi:hypothetical protein
MYPVTSSGTIRITDKPITLAGHSLPAGQPVLLPFYAIHRSPRLWQDPDSFRPERFLASHKAQAQPTAAAGAGRGSGAGAVSAGGGASAGGSIRGIEGDSDEDYVDVAADLAADTAAARDQDQREDAKQTRQLEQKQQQQGQKQEQTELKVRLEGLKGCAAEVVSPVQVSSVMRLQGHCQQTLHCLAASCSRLKVQLPQATADMQLGVHNLHMVCCCLTCPLAVTPTLHTKPLPYTLQPYNLMPAGPYC